MSSRTILFIVGAYVFNCCAILAMMEEPKKEEAKAIFAGGCFWCTEASFDGVKGVTRTTSGYIGGHVDNPSYKDVSAGNSGHREALEVTYDPTVVTYNELLDIFWQNIDPTDNYGQFADRGSQYRTAVFYLNEEQYREAVASKAAVEKRLGTKVQTEILKAGTFHPAEEYHQNYHEKNPYRYQQYKTGSGRPKRLQELWGPPHDS